MLASLSIPDWGNLDNAGRTRSDSFSSSDEPSTPPTTMLVLKDVIMPDDGEVPAIQIIDESGFNGNGIPIYDGNSLFPFWMPGIRCRPSPTLCWQPSPVKGTVQSHPVVARGELSPALRYREAKLRLELATSPLTTCDNDDGDAALQFSWSTWPKRSNAGRKRPSLSLPTTPVMERSDLPGGNASVSAPPSPRCSVPYSTPHARKHTPGPLKKHSPFRFASKSVPSSPVLRTTPVTVVAVSMSAPPSPHCLMPDMPSAISTLRMTPPSFNLDDELVPLNTKGSSKLPSSTAPEGVPWRFSVDAKHLSDDFFSDCSETASDGGFTTDDASDDSATTFESSDDDLSASCESREEGVHAVKLGELLLKTAPINIGTSAAELAATLSPRGAIHHLEATFPCDVDNYDDDNSSADGKDAELKEQITDWPVPSGVWAEDDSHDEAWPEHWLPRDAPVVRVLKSKDELRSEELLHTIVTWPVATGPWASEDDENGEWPADWLPQPAVPTLLSKLAPIAEEEESETLSVASLSVEGAVKAKTSMRKKNKKGKSKKSNKRR